MLKTYECHKVVQAEPMTRGEFLKLKDWTPPSKFTADDKGYRVIYEDGYESWSPRKAFDDGYTVKD